MSKSASNSFLHNIFDQTVHAEERELHRLTVENAFLKSKMQAMTVQHRTTENTLKKLLTNLDIITQRAATNMGKNGSAEDASHPSCSSSCSADDSEIYALAASLRPEAPLLRVQRGCAIEEGVLSRMCAHFDVMMKHAEFAFGPPKGMNAAERDKLLRHMLANLLVWVFGVKVDPESESFGAPNLECRSLMRSCRSCVRA